MKKETKVKTNITVYLIKKPSSESSKKLLNESFINYSQTLLDPDSTDNSKLISIDENTIIYYVDSKDSEPK